MRHLVGPGLNSRGAITTKARSALQSLSNYLPSLFQSRKTRFKSLKRAVLIPHQIIYPSLSFFEMALKMKPLEVVAIVFRQPLSR